MKLHYRSFGEGVPIIIVHGLYGASDNWVTIGRALADNYHVFLIDQRNHGKSPHSQAHNYALMSEDLREFMDDHDLERAVIIGHSMGGKTAMFFAAAYPERVLHLVVVDISPKSYVDIDKQQQQTTNHEHILRSLKKIDFAVLTSRQDIDKQLAEDISNTGVRQFLLKNLQRTQQGFAWKINVESLHRNLHEIMGGLNPADFEEGNEVTGFPILFIRGENSAYIQADDVDLIEHIFPFAELVTIPKAGHWVHAEQPELLLKEIEFFISR